ncbi:MAG: DUF3710 domain-containing protein [Mycobacteriales bacterium]
MFRRRSKTAPADEAGPDTEDAVLTDDAESAAEPEPAAATGPWDVDEVPDPEATRLDLGGLQIPALPDIEIRLDTDDAGSIVGVTLVAGASELRLGAFAAPRRDGIWDEVRAEILDSLRAEGNPGDERGGPFGQEIVASIAADKGKQKARFVGIDGPRWLLRAVFVGPAATNPAQAETLENALRGVVVSRGGDALPVRDPLPLALPQEILDQADEPGDEALPAPAAPRRGPEITEIG